MPPAPGAKLATCQTYATGPIGVSGAPLLVNPAPGQLGTSAYGLFRGPGAKSLNLNVIKRIRINERITAQIGATAQNATNTPIFGNPTAANLSINSTTFGRITSATGARLIVLHVSAGNPLASGLRGRRSPSAARVSGSARS